MFDSLIPPHLWPFVGMAISSVWLLALSMVVCGKKKPETVAISPVKTRSAQSNTKDKSSAKPASASVPSAPVKSKTAEPSKPSEEVKSEKKEEKTPVKEKSVKSSKNQNPNKSSMKTKKKEGEGGAPSAASTGGGGGEEKKEEDDNGYESCPDMTAEQLAKMVA